MERGLERNAVEGREEEEGGGGGERADNGRLSHHRERLDDPFRSCLAGA